jgi:cell cycle checkpoint control protein RAD9A
VPADDDRQWDVAEDEEPEAEDMLGWDATADPVRRDSFNVANVPLIGAE